MAKKIREKKPRIIKPRPEPKPTKPDEGGVTTQDDEGPGGQHPDKPGGKP
jgi:hypothetical protein